MQVTVPWVGPTSLVTVPELDWSFASTFVVTGVPALVTISSGLGVGGFSPGSGLPTARLTVTVAVSAHVEDGVGEGVGAVEPGRGGVGAHAGRQTGRGAVRRLGVAGHREHIRLGIGVVQEDVERLLVLDDEGVVGRLGRLPTTPAVPAPVATSSDVSTAKVTSAAMVRRPTRARRRPVRALMPSPLAPYVPKCPDERYGSVSAATSPTVGRGAHNLRARSAPVAPRPVRDPDGDHGTVGHPGTTRVGPPRRPVPPWPEPDPSDCTAAVEGVSEGIRECPTSVAQWFPSRSSPQPVRQHRGACRLDVSERRDERESSRVEVEIGIGKSGRQAYGFDDIAIVPSRRTRDPEDVDISWDIDAFKFELPLIGRGDGRRRLAEDRDRDRPARRARAA